MMNLITKISKIVMITFLAIGLLSCSEDDDAGDVITPTNTIADFVAENDDYSSLAAALDAAGLTATLEGSTNYTVFAPNDAAFNAFLSDNGFDSLDDVPEELLTEILLNHVQAGSMMATDLSTGYIESMATGMASDENLSMYINTEDGIWVNGMAEVIQADIEADNGIIHAVDAVIGLPDIVDFATADPTFDVLVQALSREDDYEFVDILQMTQDPAPFTVFAPTNDAFMSLLGELEIEALANIDSDVLAATLSYHIATGMNVRSADLSDGMEVETYHGGLFTVNVGERVSLTDANDRESNVIATNVQANNGVIHVLDTVILPGME